MPFDRALVTGGLSPIEVCEIHRMEEQFDHLRYV